MLSSSLLIRLSRARSLLDIVNESAPPVEEVAADIGMSTYHFIRLYKTVFGETPHQHRIRARLTKAKHLLMASEFSVTEVCLAVGYTSMGSFSELFVRRFAVTPSDYRRRFRPMVTAGTPKQLMPCCFSLMGGAPK
ncbi:helix-turn-helix domain-containing protein [Gilvimarinus sp. F26214L]|uniref:helix-turn-helix domain-containing protein n=1 Tax=Gilvimarinus sp. DZF01 TaxID=3461371 RepID=UPI0040465441